ncbi:TPA: hypothetical protein RP439_003773 [Acinetobacter baumannii]|uniref:hypothetical protein n=1 Tax=Acinetobacter baumannii TaxID=470 RepID=UPI00165F1A81|nr:hypothetical protein [Acinetobacter baumannii]MBD0080800.1 hypothetical protein [Acinetobacter baumannii]MBP5038779.1 hypothetical protein [Acinetobacter baumannii]MDV7494542.1 hypothetical protein [Acinetobacter baumannii]HCH8074836.1 hypothetical protein [Acinetobacter baumannii]HDI2489305.1 hypothetical protein [Acinetobacter baumannii]
MSSKKENLPYQTTVIEVTETSIIGAKSLSVKMDEHRYKQLRLNALEKGMTHREILTLIYMCGRGGRLLIHILVNQSLLFIDPSIMLFSFYRIRYRSYRAICKTLTSNQ